MRPITTGQSVLSLSQIGCWLMGGGRKHTEEQCGIAWRAETLASHRFHRQEHRVNLGKAALKNQRQGSVGGNKFCSQCKKIYIFLLVLCCFISATEGGKQQHNIGVWEFLQIFEILQFHELQFAFFFHPNITAGWNKSGGAAPPLQVSYCSLTFTHLHIRVLKHIHTNEPNRATGADVALCCPISNVRIVTHVYVTFPQRHSRHDVRVRALCARIAAPWERERSVETASRFGQKCVETQVHKQTTRYVATTTDN